MFEIMSLRVFLVVHSEREQSCGVIRRPGNMVPGIGSG